MARLTGTAAITKFSNTFAKLLVALEQNKGFLEKGSIDDEDWDFLDNFLTIPITIRNGYTNESQKIIVEEDLDKMLHILDHQVGKLQSRCYFFLLKLCLDYGKNNKRSWLIMAEVLDMIDTNEPNATVDTLVIEPLFNLVSTNSNDSWKACHLLTSLVQKFDDLKIASLGLVRKKINFVLGRIIYECQDFSTRNYLVELVGTLLPSRKFTTGIPFVAKLWPADYCEDLYTLFPPGAKAGDKECIKYLKMVESIFLREQMKLKAQHSLIPLSGARILDHDFNKSTLYCQILTESLVIWYPIPTETLRLQPLEVCLNTINNIASEGDKITFKTVLDVSKTPSKYQHRFSMWTLKSGFKESTLQLILKKSEDTNTVVKAIKLGLSSIITPPSKKKISKSMSIIGLNRTSTPSQDSELTEFSDLSLPYTTSTITKATSTSNATHKVDMSISQLADIARNLTKIGEKNSISLKKDTSINVSKDTMVQQQKEDSYEKKAVHTYKRLTTILSIPTQKQNNLADSGKKYNGKKTISRKTKTSNTTIHKDHKNVDSKGGRNTNTSNETIDFWEFDDSSSPNLNTNPTISDNPVASIPNVKSPKRVRKPAKGKKLRGIPRIGSQIESTSKTSNSTNTKLSDLPKKRGRPRRKPLHALSKGLEKLTPTIDTIAPSQTKKISPIVVKIIGKSLPTKEQVKVQTTQALDSSEINHERQDSRFVPSDSADEYRISPSIRAATRVATNVLPTKDNKTDKVEVIINKRNSEMEKTKISNSIQEGAKHPSNLRANGRKVNNNSNPVSGIFIDEGRKTSPKSSNLINRDSVSSSTKIQFANQKVTSNDNNANEKGLTGISLERADSPLKILTQTNQSENELLKSIPSESNKAVLKSKKAVNELQATKSPSKPTVSHKDETDESKITVDTNEQTLVNESTVLGKRKECILNYDYVQDPANLSKPDVFHDQVFQGLNAISFSLIKRMKFVEGVIQKRSDEMRQDLENKIQALVEEHDKKVENFGKYVSQLHAKMETAEEELVDWVKNNRWSG